MMEFIVDLDKSLFLLINGANHPILDAFMMALSGKWFWLPFYAYLIYVVFERFGFRALYIIFLTALLITASDQLSVHLFKNMVQRLRPCHEPSLANLVHIVNEYCGGKFGFISSHAANVFALAVFIGNVLRPFGNTWKYILLTWAIMVSYSRIYLGAHYPLDVLCGAALGIILAKLNYAFLTGLNKRFELKLLKQ